jgi:RNA polymerase sigma-70 factor, ECF subfamily
VIRTSEPSVAPTASLDDDGGGYRGVAMERAAEAMMPQLYEELRRIAARLRRRPADESIAPTILVHEAWLRLQGWSGAWQDEAHFRATAAQAMRQILVDRARRRAALRRGGGGRRTTLTGLSAPDTPVDIVDLDAALRELDALDPLGARIVELRYFGGLSIPETAQAVGRSERAVSASWRLSRAWLEARLGRT